jgi:hypothetical protein
MLRLGVLDPTVEEIVLGHVGGGGSGPGDDPGGRDLGQSSDSRLVGVGGDLLRSFD